MLTPHGRLKSRATLSALAKGVLAGLLVTLLAGLAIAAWIGLSASSPGAASGERIRCDLPDDRTTRFPGMVWVPGGTFMVGDTVYAEEGPLQTRRVDGFWMDRTEVTNAEFARFVAATGYVTIAERPVDTAGHPGMPTDMQQPGAVVFTMPTDLQRGGDITQWWKYRAGASWRHPQGPGSSIEGKDSLPAVALTWEDAQAYARWRGTELPSEAQWEWAARGGAVAKAGDTTQPGQANTWQGFFPVRNQADDGFSGVAPVGCFAPNGYGLFDMIGNVWELTADVYRPFHDAQDNLAPDQLPPAARAPVPGRQHVIKGGSYLCAPSYCMRYRASARQGTEDDLATGHVGFRTILRAPP